MRYLLSFFRSIGFALPVAYGAQVLLNRCFVGGYKNFVRKSLELTLDAVSTEVPEVAEALPELRPLVQKRGVKFGERQLVKILHTYCMKGSLTLDQLAWKWTHHRRQVLAKLLNEPGTFDQKGIRNLRTQRLDPKGDFFLVLQLGGEDETARLIDRKVSELLPCGLGVSSYLPQGAMGKLEIVLYGPSYY